MGNKYSQTNEAKTNYNSPLLQFMGATALLDPKHVFTRDEIANHLNCSDRAARREVEKLANYYPIISVSSKQGYRYGIFRERTLDADLEELERETDHALAELESRVKSLQARMKPLIAFKAKLREEIELREFDKILVEVESEEEK